MKSLHRILLSICVLTVAIGATACTAEFTRNSDGSLTVISTISEANLEDEMQLALQDSFTEVTAVDLRDGAMFVEAVRQRLLIEGNDTLTFRVDFGTTDGHLTAEISELAVNSAPPDGERPQEWANRIEEHLSLIGTRSDRASLTGVSISNDELILEWHVETPRSRGELPGDSN